VVHDASNTVSRALVPLIAVCILCAGCGGKATSTGSSSTQTTTTKIRKPTGGFVTARARFAGMNCGTIGLHGGAAIGRYALYVCAGPDNTNLHVPAGAYVCWGFHDFGAGHDQPAVELNLMDAAGKTIGGHVYPDTTVNCGRTLRAVAGVIS
jgi:hypothetical protein